MTSTNDSPEPQEHTESRLHVWLRRAWITVAVALAILALGIGADRATGSMCGGCHEIGIQVASQALSGHAQLECPDCHEPTRPWYRFPETLALRMVMLTRNLGSHLEAEREGANPLDDLQVSIADDKCLECHDPSREVSLRVDGALLDHTEHVKLNDSCISCHRFTAHPVPGVEPALQFMLQCFDCHGLSETAEAPGECEVCHPETYDLLPDSHRPEEWQEDHGSTAVDERELCLMCHEESFCDDCHGIEMPHPDGWAEGSTAHGPRSEQARTVCERCHGETPDFCTVCHHEAYKPTSGTWVAQHPVSATRRGSAYCFECHDPTFCVRCHTAPWAAAEE